MISLRKSALLSVLAMASASVFAQNHNMAQPFPGQLNKQPTLKVKADSDSTFSTSNLFENAVNKRNFMLSIPIANYKIGEGQSISTYGLRGDWTFVNSSKSGMQVTAELHTGSSGGLDLKGQKAEIDWVSSPFVNIPLTFVVGAGYSQTTVVGLGAELEGDNLYARLGLKTSLVTPSLKFTPAIVYKHQVAGKTKADGVELNYGKSHGFDLSLRVQSKGLSGFTAEPYISTLKATGQSTHTETGVRLGWTF